MKTIRRFTGRAAVCLALGMTLAGCSSCRDDSDAAGGTAAGAAEGEGSGSGDGFAVYATEGSGAAAGIDDAGAAVMVDGEVVLTIAEQEERLAAMVERYESLPSRQETTAAWRDQRRDIIADRAVEDFVMARYIRDNPPEITAEMFDEHLRETLGAVYDDDVLYPRLLAQRGMTRDEYEASERQSLAEDLLLSERGSIEPTEDEIVAFYERNRERFQEEERALVRTITVRLRRGASDQEDAEALARIRELHERVTSGGEDFAEVASTESETLDRLDGGLIGWLVRGRRPELSGHGVEDLLFSAPLNEVTEPVRTELGYQIFRVEDRREAGIRGLDEVRGTIAAPVRRATRERLRREMIRELLADADVNYLLERWELESGTTPTP